MNIWPTFAEIEAMESTQAYGLYYGLPAPMNAHQIEIIRALGDQAWKMRQEEDAGKAKPKYLPMPAPAPVEVPPEAPAQPPPPPAPVEKKKPQPAAPKEEERGGSLFFLAALKS